MIVPPGFSGDTFPIRASSGERVTITPPGVTNIGEGMTLNISVGEGAGQIDFQEAVEDALRELLA